MSTQVQTTNLDIEYYEWLTSQVQINSQKTYYGLFEIMHNTEFTWFIPNDDNRVADGLHLRQHFMRSVHDRRYEDGDLSLEWVSFLEVLIALSRRVEFIAEGDAPYWAWRLIKNIRLNKASDPLSNVRIEKIKVTLDDLIWRNYESSGFGGFFPLERTLKDQTKIEIWYQMQEYVIEIEEMD